MPSNPNAPNNLSYIHELSYTASSVLIISEFGSIFLLGNTKLERLDPTLPVQPSQWARTLPRVQVCPWLLLCNFLLLFLLLFWCVHSDMYCSNTCTLRHVTNYVLCGVIEFSSVRATTTRSCCLACWHPDARVSTGNRLIGIFIVFVEIVIFVSLLSIFFVEIVVFVFLRASWDWSETCLSTNWFVY